MRAGLDIVTDGEMRFDADIGGRSWFGYLFDRMEGLEPNAGPNARELGTPRRISAPAPPCLAIFLPNLCRPLRPPQVVAPVHPGTLQYDAVWKVAQKMTDKPVKFGSCCGQMVERQSRNKFYKDRKDSVFAFSDALNREHNRLADAGCQVIQLEEPCLHGSAGAQQEIPFEVFIEAFNRETKGLRAKTEVWCHTCWGNPFAQRLSNRPSYGPTAHLLAQLDVDVITIEAADNDGADIASIAKHLGKDKKLCIGVLSHRDLQVELPDEIAALIRKALETYRAGTPDPVIRLRFWPAGHEPNPRLLQDDRDGARRKYRQAGTWLAGSGNSGGQGRIRAVMPRCHRGTCGTKIYGFICL